MRRYNKYIIKWMKKSKALLTLNEAKLLFTLPKNIPKQGVIVEIGSLKGGSTILLAKGAKIANKGRVYSIDPYKIYLESGALKVEPKNALPIFLKNIKDAGVDDWITQIVKPSLKAAKNWKSQISLLWIDGNHEYENVKTDFLLWEKHLVVGGIIVFHDSQESSAIIPHLKKPHPPIEGPRRFVREYIIKSKRFGNINIVDSATAAQKIQKADYKELLMNRLSLPWLKILIMFKSSKKNYKIIYNKFDRKLGIFGIFLKSNYPKLYFLIKKIKERTKQWKKMKISL